MDFHGVIMIAALIIWVPFLMLKKRYVWAMALAFILMNFKEDATVYLGGLGVILALSYEEKRWGWILAGAAMVYYIMVHSFLWNMIAPMHLNFFAARFPNLIQSDKPLLLLILSDPLQLIYPALNWDRLWGLLAIFAPVLFLPFLRRGWLGLLPALWILFTMELYSIHIFSGYYAGVVFSLILIAAIPGLFRIQQKRPQRLRPTAWLMLGFLAGSWFFIQPDVSFSYFMPINLRPHPYNEIVQRIAEETPAGVSVSSDKNIGSYFFNRHTLRYFPDPENRLSERIYITNQSLCYPLTILAIGSLEYKLLQPNPCFLFLTNSEGGDAAREFMSRLGWTEAEGASTALWSCETDKRASGGSAIHIVPGTAYGDVIVKTNKVFLPLGDYSYSIKVKKGRRNQANPRLPVVICFLKPDGSEMTLAEKTFLVGEAANNPGEYEDLSIPFAVNEPGLIYLRINFGYKFDLWWDGIELDGLNIDFDEYFRAVFPVEITPAHTSYLVNTFRPAEPIFPDSLATVGNIDRRMVIYSLQLGNDFPAGDYWIYYAADAVEDGEMSFEWADLMKDACDESESDTELIMPLIFDRRGNNRDIQLNLSPAPVALASGDRLEIRAYPGLPATIRLKGIWLMNPVVTDYLLYLR